MQTFTKHERLSSQKSIDKLFEKGKTYIVSPFRVIWLIEEKSAYFPAQVLISVSKKRIRKAVDRNIIKRRVREAYRKNKSGFYEFLNRKHLGCVLALLYNSEVTESYQEVERKIILLLQRFESEYEKSIK